MLYLQDFLIATSKLALSERQIVVRTAELSKTARGAEAESWHLYLGTPATPRPRLKDSAGRCSVLVASPALWPARWLLGFDQRNHRIAIQHGRYGFRIT